MPRKPVEKEEEINVTKPKKKSTFITRWFDQYACNNRSEMKTVCDLTARSCDEQFCLYVAETGNTEVFAVIFYATFMEILAFLREKEKLYNKFSIVIANSINIGYTNDDNKDNEKVGNFMPFMEHIGVNYTVVRDKTAEIRDNTSHEMFMRWTETNSKKNVEYYKEIQERAFQRLQSEYHTMIATSEAIIPIFCTFMDHIVNLLKMKYMELEGTGVSEVSFNVFGLFDAYYSYNDDPDAEGHGECVDFIPNISMKLAIKSDEVASRGE